MTITNRHADILRFLAGTPDGGCPMTWLPDTIDFHAYIGLRNDGMVEEKPGRGGFIDTYITKKGRTALRRYDEANPT